MPEISQLSSNNGIGYSGNNSVCSLCQRVCGAGKFCSGCGAQLPSLQPQPVRRWKPIQFNATPNFAAPIAKQTNFTQKSKIVTAVSSKTPSQKRIEEEFQRWEDEDQKRRLPAHGQSTETIAIRNHVEQENQTFETQGQPLPEQHGSFCRSMNAPENQPDMKEMNGGKQNQLDMNDANQASRSPDSRELDLEDSHLQATVALEESQQSTAQENTNVSVNGVESQRRQPIEQNSNEEMKRQTAQVTNKAAVTIISGAGKGALASRWQQMLQDKQQEEHVTEREKIRNRRKGGVQFMDRQIRMLIAEMKKLSNSTPATVNFGVLFKETQATMPALSATLACAKKRGVVQFEGTMLMQGACDHVVITLLKEEIKDSNVFKSMDNQGAMLNLNAAISSQQAVDDHCHRCEDTVYATERLVANGKVLHKGCFKCKDCNCHLSISKYAFHNDEFLCETHFQRKFQENSNYNF